MMLEERFYLYVIFLFRNDIPVEIHNTIDMINNNPINTF